MGLRWHCAHNEAPGTRPAADNHAPTRNGPEYYAHFRVSNNLLELRNLVQVAELIVRCAMMRKENRGLHFTLDYPELLTHSGPSILSPAIIT